MLVFSAVLTRCPFLFTMFVQVEFDFWVRLWIFSGCWRQRLRVALVVLLVSQVAGKPWAVNCFLSSLPCSSTLSVFPGRWYFPHMTNQNMLAVTMQGATTANTSLQMPMYNFSFYLQRCNAVRRVHQVSLERFLLLKFLFIPCHYTACLILEIYFSFPSYNFLQMEHLLLKEISE